MTALRLFVEWGILVVSTLLLTNVTYQGVRAQNANATGGNSTGDAGSGNATAGGATAAPGGGNAPGNAPAGGAVSGGASNMTKQDLGENCQRNYCDLELYQPLMVRYCAKTCSHLFVNGTVPCTDAHIDCALWKRRGYCASELPSILDKVRFCPRTCSLCPLRGIIDRYNVTASSNPGPS